MDATGRIELPAGPRELFEAAEPVLSEFFGAYRLGGGTILAALWGHRHSTDVDFFAEPSHYQAVFGKAGRELERALVSRVPGVLAERSWVEPEAVFLDCGDSGEITLMPAPRFLPENAAAGVVGSSRVAADGVEEILGGKVRRWMGAGWYRIRDLYDVAFARRAGPAALSRVLAAEGPRRLRQIAAELSTLEEFEGTLIRPQWPATGTAIRDEVVAICLSAAAEAAEREGDRE